MVQYEGLTAASPPEGGIGAANLMGGVWFQFMWGANKE